MKIHTHFWIEVSRDSGSVYYECSCGAAKVVSEGAKNA